MGPHNALQRINDSADFTMLDPGDAGTIRVNRWFANIPLVSTGAQTRTLARPTRVGQRCTLNGVTVAGDITITVTGGYNEAGSTSIVVTAAGQYVDLVAVSASATTLEWRVVGFDGATVTAPAVSTGTFTTLTATTINNTTLAGSAGRFSASLAVGGALPTNPQAQLALLPAANASGVTANQSYHHATVNPGGAVTIPTGTAPVVSSVNIHEPNITATGTVTVACSLRIVDAPTEGGSNYALWVDAGTSRFDGNIELNGSPGVSGLRTTALTTAVAITGTTALVLADSGGVFSVAQSSAYDIDLPSPTSGPGLHFNFYLTAAGSFDVTITVASGAATFVGTVINDVTSVLPCTGNTLTFKSGVAVLGDNVEVISISTSLYLVRTVSSANGGITIT